MDLEVFHTATLGTTAVESFVKDCFYTRKLHSSRLEPYCEDRDILRKKKNPATNQRIKVFSKQVFQCCCNQTESQAHRMDEAGRDPWRLSSPMPVRKQGLLEQVAQGCSSTKPVVSPVLLEHGPPAFYKTSQTLVKWTLMVRSMDFLRLEYEVCW